MSTTSSSPIGVVVRYGLLIGPLLSMIASSIVNVAVPDIATELEAQLDDAQWVVPGKRSRRQMRTRG